MKKIIAVFLLLALTLAACGTQEPIAYGDHFVHQTPEDKQEYTKLLLERESFDEHIANVMNIHAYPDLFVLDKTGYEVIGMYIYDPETGLASGWTDLETGDRIMFEPGKEKNLGKPDASKMVSFGGPINLGFAVYEQEGKAIAAELYFFLSDAEDAAVLQRFMLDYYSEVLVQESETVYKIIKDAEAVEKDFKLEEQAGAAFYNRDAADYASVLRINYGVKEVEE